MSVVELAGVGLARDGVEVLSGVDLRVDEGERVALLGASGSGKTSLLRCVAGLDRPDRGRVVVRGQDVAGQRGDVAMVFEDAAVYEHLDVEGNLRLPLTFSGSDGDVAETGRRFAIGGLFRRRPATLSEGQRGLVAAARAVVRPEVTLVLLDEVLVGTDPLRRRRIIDSLLGDMHITVLFATNDPDDVFRHAHRVVVLDGGTVAQTGRPIDVYRTPVSLAVAGLLGEVNRFPATVVEQTAGAASGHETGFRLAVGVSRLDTGNLPDDVEEGTRVVVAVRPADLRPATPATPFSRVLTGTVGRVEPSGRYTRVLFGIGDAPGTAFSGMWGPDARVAVGDRVAWAVEPTRMSLFRPSTGARL